MGPYKNIFYSQIKSDRKVKSFYNISNLSIDKLFQIFFINKLSLEAKFLITNISNSQI